MKSIELARRYLNESGYRISSESDNHIAFRYQMNTIHFWDYEEEDNFFFIALADFEDVTDDNIAELKELCHEANTKMKQVKLYINKNLLLAAAELYFLAEDDFRFQMKTALKNLVSAKVMFKKLHNNEL